MAAGDPGSPARYYSSTAVETALGSSIPAQSQGQANTSFIVGSISGFPTDYPYSLIVDPDTSKEEVVTVTAGSGTTLTVTRGSDNTQAVAHSAGAVVRHGVSGREFRESENHIAARGYDIDQTILNAANQTHVHGIATGDGVIVGTLKTQTLTNKTLTTPTISGATISGAVTSTATITGGTVTSATITSSTISTSTFTGSFTASSATFVSPTISGSPVITGLSSAGMSSSSAAPKSYVDAILVLQEASAASSATSASMAAASATSAATSATSAAASAATAAASVATIAGYATSAANSATAAATSATSAAASATAAATSATSAAASATASASSASASATSATAAATSATSASASATAAATSATSAAASATAAATSATSAAASATAAATSAADALTSANSAATTYDNFDDRYLGAKSVAPTTDNDGNPLLTGALYFNSVLSAMYVWTGTVWSVMATSGDIESVTAGTGLTGGGASGAVTVALDTTSAYVVPTQTGQNGKFLTTDGTSSSWAAVDALPSQTGNAGEFLTTDGTTASWAAVAGSLAQPTEPTSPTDGQIWIDTDGTAVGNQTVRWSKAPANGTTVLSGNDDNSVPLSYVAGYEQVYLNGVLLSRVNDYTATNGSSVTLSTATITGDIVEIFASLPVAIVDVYTQAQANAAFINDSLLTTTGDIIYASGANTPARRGIGTTGQVLTVSGGVPAWTTLSTTPTAVGAQVLRTTTQVITGGTTTAVSWSSAGTNTDSIWSSGSATRFTIPSGKGGVYQVSTSITFNNASGQVQFYIYKNGSALTNYSYVTALNASNINGGSMNAILTLAAGDYIEIFVKSNNTAEIIAGVSSASIFYIGV